MASPPLDLARPGPRRPARRRRSLVGWRFVSPFMALFALVFLAPIGYSIYLSLYKTKLIGGTQFVGLQNYSDAFHDSQFWTSFARVALFLVVQVPIMLGLALLLALAIDSGRLYGAAFFRISVFLPYAVPAVVATLMWSFMYGTQFGLVRDIDKHFGVTLPDPLSPHLILASIGNIVTWEWVGYNMLILYSALRVVNPSLYEAAAIEGAGQFRLIFSIKLPALRPAPGHRDDLLDHRQLPAVQRAQHPQAPGAERDHHVLHAELLRLLAVLRGPAVQLLRDRRHRHGRGHDDRRLRRPAARHAKGG